MKITATLSADQIATLSQIVRKVPVADHVARYAIQFARLTRRDEPQAPDFIKEMVDWGAGPRAGQYLILGGKACAAMGGRYTVSIEDIRAVAVPVLRHRIACNFAAASQGIDTVEITRRLIEHVPEPEVPKYKGAAANK